MGRTQKDNFFLVGISHKTAPVEIREKVSIESASYCEILNGLTEIDGIAECVVLSTCNRTEIYAVISIPADDAGDAIENYLLKTTGAGSELKEHFYRLHGENAIIHLFKVASGLDSMILGEPQIFGQVKTAYSVACDTTSTGPAINRLFHHTFKVGKLIRNMTAIGEGAVSVSFAAVEKAKHIFGKLNGKTVLLVGAGKTGELSAKKLVDSGIDKLIITNRTPERAKELAEKLDGEIADFDNFLSAAETSDIIISSIASHDPVITRAGIEPYINKRGNNPLLLIDLGVPRNIEASAGDFDNVTLLNIDDLEELTIDNMDKRKLEAEKAEEMIINEVDEFSTWLSEREVIPVIRDLHDNCEMIRSGEMEKVKNRVGEEAFEVIDLVTRRIVRKILHNPVIAMRESEKGEQRERLLSAVRELFIYDSDPGDRNCR